jgi:hypothetical protein
MALALALTTAQLDALRTIASPLEHRLRARFLARLGEELNNRGSIGDGELSRRARQIMQELQSPPPARLKSVRAGQILDRAMENVK